MVGPEGPGFLKKHKTLADGSPIHFPRILSYGSVNLRTKLRNDLVLTYGALGDLTIGSVLIINDQSESIYSFFGYA
jgi:hypothetical protein